MFNLVIFKDHCSDS